MDAESFAVQDGHRGGRAAGSVDWDCGDRVRNRQCVPLTRPQARQQRRENRLVVPEVLTALQVGCAKAEEADMHRPCLQVHHLPEDHRGGRNHRFMESADIGSAFRETFVALRTNLRRGLQTPGQFYALTMDACIPGDLVDTTWLPAAAYGLPCEYDVAAGADPDHPDHPGHPDHPPAADRPAVARQRHALLRRWLARPGAPPLLVWVGELVAADGQRVVRVEVASADGLFATEHRVGPGRGWRRRELLRVPHRRCTGDALI